MSKPFQMVNFRRIGWIDGENILNILLEMNLNWYTVIQWYTWQTTNTRTRMEYLYIYWYLVMTRLWHTNTYQYDNFRLTYVVLVVQSYHKHLNINISFKKSCLYFLFYSLSLSPQKGSRRSFVCFLSLCLPQSLYWREAQRFLHIYFMSFWSGGRLGFSEIH